MVPGCTPRFRILGRRSCAPSSPYSVAPVLFDNLERYLFRRGIRYKFFWFVENLFNLISRVLTARSRFVNIFDVPLSRGQRGGLLRTRRRSVAVHLKHSFFLIFFRRCENVWREDKVLTSSLFTDLPTGSKPRCIVLSS